MPSTNAGDLEQVRSNALQTVADYRHVVISLEVKRIAGLQGWRHDVGTTLLETLSADKPPLDRQGLSFDRQCSLSDWFYFYEGRCHQPSPFWSNGHTYQQSSVCGQDFRTTPVDGT